MPANGCLRGDCVLDQVMVACGIFVKRDGNGSIGVIDTVLDAVGHGGTVGMAF